MFVNSTLQVLALVPDRLRFFESCCRFLVTVCDSVLPVPCCNTNQGDWQFNEPNFDPAVDLQIWSYINYSHCNILGSASTIPLVSVQSNQNFSFDADTHLLDSASCISTSLRHFTGFCSFFTLSGGGILATCLCFLEHSDFNLLWKQTSCPETFSYSDLQKRPLHLCK